jgi:preprotein translocase subunit SecE
MQAIQFLKEVREELSKVVWPTKEQTIRLTVIVVAVTLIVSAFIGGVDYLLAQLASYLLQGK